MLRSHERRGVQEGTIMADQSIELTAYDPTWPTRFAEQQKRLATILQPWLAGEIEHVGSTSVPGLRSKPTVDILAPVQSLGASRTAIPVLEKDGWLFWPDDPNHNYRLWFLRPSPAARTHHLPGFSGTAGLSATPVRPACPSRASG